jgi:hypothetical protein
MLNSRNAIPLCTAAGLAVGLLLALTLGSIFSVGGSSLMFEMGIYTFAGIVGGSALGGFVGFLLTGILPNASDEDVGEQMFGGVINAIGGLLVAGVALAFFWYFREVEAQGADPEGAMPKIIWLAYNLTGKWGMLILVGGAGIILMVIGIRKMIPEPAPKQKPKASKGQKSVKKKKPPQDPYANVPTDWE